MNKLPRSSRNNRKRLTSKRVRAEENKYNKEFDHEEWENLLISKKEVKMLNIIWPAFILIERRI